MAKKVVGYVIILALFVGSFFGIYFGINLKVNEDKYKDNIEYVEEINDLKSELSTANSNYKHIKSKYENLTAENEQNKQELANSKEELSQMSLRLDTLTAEKESVETTLNSVSQELQNTKLELANAQSQNETDSAKISELEIKISELESEKQTLNTQLLEKQNSIDELNTQIVSLQNEITSLETTITEKDREISSLNSQIIELNNEIERLNSLLSAYEKYENSSLILTYYVDNVLFDTQIVSMGETTSQSITPEDTEKYSFVKWQIAGEDFDFETYNFNKNTRIDAVLNYNIYTVNFIYNDEDYYSVEVYGGEFVTGYTIPTYDESLEEYKGVKLSLDDSDYVDLDNYKIIKDETFYVIVETKYTSIQNFDANDIQSSYAISSVDDYVKLSDLCNNGNTFEGVTIYQTEDVDFSGLEKWKPIGNTQYGFRGNFNGLDHKILNFSFKDTLINHMFSFTSSSGSTVKYAQFGLFGSIYGNSESRLTFSNLIFENVGLDITFGNEVSLSNYYRYVGIISGTASNVDFNSIIFDSGSVIGPSNSGSCNVGAFTSSGSCFIYDSINKVDFSYCNRLNLFYNPSASKFESYNCINYGNVDKVKILNSLISDTSTKTYGNSNFGVFTNCTTTNGLPSYELDESETEVSA